MTDLRDYLGQLKRAKYGTLTPDGLMTSIVPGRGCEWSDDEVIAIIAEADGAQYEISASAGRISEIKLYRAR